MLSQQKTLGTNPCTSPTMTAIRAMAAQLHEEEAKEAANQELLQRVLKDAPFGFIILDESFRVVFSNRAAQLVLGNVGCLGTWAGQKELRSEDGSRVLGRDDLPAVRVLAGEKEVHQTVQLNGQSNGLSVQINAYQEEVGGKRFAVLCVWKL